MYSLASLLLEPELYLEVGIAPHHEEEGGVEAAQVAVVTPGQTDHLPEQDKTSQDPMERSWDSHD